MLYYFIAYSDKKVSSTCDYWENLSINNTYQLRHYHNLTRIIKLVGHPPFLSGIRGEIYPEKGDYVIWTPETNNILIK